MRREPEHFGEEELRLIYVAARLEEAQAIEGLLQERSVDYLVEADTYTGGVVFRRERVGAFFYVRAADLERVQAALREGGYRPHRAGSAD